MLERLDRHDNAVAISALSLAELERGVYRSPANTAIRRRRLQIMLRNIPVLPFTEHAAIEYGQIIALCGYSKGRDFDRLIAAHAIASGSILVTDNLADFKGIPGLATENWVAR